ncbi:MAG TPA: response regulator transcription factor [Planctomycetota bacterium]|nr:response regulator transcription factor [Planctomycetota bacterium]
MTRQETILVVEDEASMLAGLEYALAKEGYLVHSASDGDSALSAARKSLPDLILLDVMLPRRSGFDVLRALRKEGRNVPVILLTAKGQELDKVHGFDLGADDYVTKPFSLAELLARIRARLRSRTSDAPDAFDLSDARVDLKRMRIEHGAQSHELSLREVDMLKLLWQERGKAVSRERFLTDVWGHERFPSTRTVDQHMVKLRQKIELDPADPKHLLTAFGVGYRLEI